MSQLRYCKTCKEHYPFTGEPNGSHFRWNRCAGRRRPDGTHEGQWVCKACHRRRAKARYDKKPEVLRAAVRRYTSKNKEKIQQLWRSYYSENREELKKKAKQEARERRLARALARTHVRRGKMKRGPCHVCGTTKGHIDGHHTDYAKKTDVVWLCRKHHSWVHHGRLSLLLEQHLKTEMGA